MNLDEAIFKRRSVRNFSDKKVEREKILRCIESARLAPSACNSQPWKYVIIDDDKIKEQVAKNTVSPIVTFNKFVLSAPIIIAVVVEKSSFAEKINTVLTDKEFNLIDIGLSVENLCLTATQEELGTCILGWFKEKAIKNILEIPKSKKLCLLIAIGYSNEDNVNKKSRKELEEIYSFNKY